MKYYFLGVSIVFVYIAIENVLFAGADVSLLEADFVRIRNVRDMDHNHEIKVGSAQVLIQIGSQMKVDDQAYKLFSRYREIKTRVANPPFSAIRGVFLLKIDKDVLVITVWDWQNYVTVGRAYSVTERVWQEGWDGDGDIANANDKDFADTAKKVLAMLEENTAKKKKISSSNQQDKPPK